MKRVVGQYGLSLLYAIIVIALLSIMLTLFISPDSQFALSIPQPEHYQVKAGDNKKLNEKTQPILKVKSGIAELNAEFNVHDFVVEAKDEYGQDLKNTNRITYRGEVNTALRGYYNIEIIMSTENFIQTKKITVTVD